MTTTTETLTRRATRWHIVLCGPEGNETQLVTADRERAEREVEQLREYFPEQTWRMLRSMDRV